METSTKPKNGYPPLVELQLPHYRQKFNWDCGVSCVLMVLPQVKREHFISNFTEVCKEENFNKSTWTIDLCYLLHRYNVRHVYYTITLGVHPGYRGQTFYDKILPNDEERVTKRFSEAEGRGLEVRRASLSTRELMRHLATSGPVILLTNSNQLHCDVCKSNRLAVELRGCFPWSVTYQGHYIVLCGYNLQREKFFFRNPSCKNRVCAISFPALEEARRSYGTDEDAIFIHSNVWT